MTCDCPSSVLSTIANQVQIVLDRINAIKNLTDSFNRFLIGVVGGVTDNLDAWIALIPSPPGTSISELIQLLTCPLTPLAIAIQNNVQNYRGPWSITHPYRAGEIVNVGSVVYAANVNTLGQSPPAFPGVWAVTNPIKLGQADPRLLYYALQAQYQAMIKNVKAQYAATTAALQSATVVQYIQRYLREIQRLLGDPYEFAIQFPLTVGYVAYVRAVCPEIYSNPSYPYTAFSQAITQWNITGLLPTGLDPSVLPIVSRVATAETKILQWQQLLTLTL